jgi:hypothetical protein
LYRKRRQDLAPFIFNKEIALGYVEYTKRGAMGQEKSTTYD